VPHFFGTGGVEKSDRRGARNALLSPGQAVKASSQGVTLVTDLPSYGLLQQTLVAAAEAHEDYERGALKGVVDMQWPGFHAAYVLGRLGDFVPASRLAALLAEVNPQAEWEAAAAEHVLMKLRS
jgi:hypothetical protein